MHARLRLRVTDNGTFTVTASAVRRMTRAPNLQNLNCACARGGTLIFSYSTRPHHLKPKSANNWDGEVIQVPTRQRVQRSDGEAAEVAWERGRTRALRRNTFRLSVFQNESLWRLNPVHIRVNLDFNWAKDSYG